MQKHVALLKSHAVSPGGLEKATTRILSAFVAKGAKVTVLTTGKAPQDLPSISFQSVDMPRMPSFLRLEKFDRFTREWLAKNPCDLIFGMDRNRRQTHIRAGNGVHDAFLQSRSFTEGKWKELFCRCNPKHQKILSLEKTAFEHPELKKLFTNSHMVQNQILQRYRVDEAKIEVIHNGVEWLEMEGEFTLWPEKRRSLFQRFRLDPNLFHFLFIGNGFLRKGLKQLLLGLSRLSSKDVHLSIVGKDKHMESYQMEAERLGLSKRVRFFGEQADTLPFYQMADALIIPSFYDPFANVTVEALAMGLFVISSRYNGGVEILDSQNGSVIEDLLDPDAMKTALEAALLSPKTWDLSLRIRGTVKHLDFSLQMNRLMEACFA